MRRWFKSQKEKEKNQRPTDCSGQSTIHFRLILRGAQQWLKKTLARTC